MITGPPTIISSKHPDADRDFLRDTLKLTHVDVGHGWLIFGLPPSEVAIHPARRNSQHELYLMCDDIAAFVAEMKSRKTACGPVRDQGWGILTQTPSPAGENWAAMNRATRGRSRCRRRKPSAKTVERSASADHPADRA